MNPVAISLSPNTGREDVRAAINVVFRKEHESTLKDVEQQISVFLQGKKAVLATSGRQALMDILVASGIGRGDEVIMQAFTCIAVAESILWSGATPVYADIERDTYNLSIQSVKDSITSKTKAIIVQHTFGIPGPVNELVEIAREKNILLIEDCAVSFGGMHDSKPLGTFGEAAIVSFGRDKMISSVFGGAAITSDQKLLSSLRSVAAERSYPPLQWVRQQLFHPIIFALILPTYRIGIGKGILWLAQRFNLLSKAYEPQEKRAKKPTHLMWKYPPALARLVHVQLKNFAPALNRRRAIAQRYHNALSGSAVALPVVSPMSVPSWLRFPVWVENKEELLRKAKQQGMLLGDWYEGPLMPVGNEELFGYRKGMCPIAEDATKHVINLPTYPRLSDSQVEAVIELIKTYAN